MKTDFLPLDLYVSHLKTINGISFTRREIEVMAFLISGRGIKAIAFSLSISPKTVKTHVHNIMLKLECNSRESIISFIEKSDKLFFIRSHYSNLLMALSFDQTLAEILKLNGGASLSCLMICWRGDNEIHPLIHQLEPHLKKVGFKISVENRHNTQSIEELLSEAPSQDTVIYCLPKNFPEPSKQTITCVSNVLFLLPEGLTKEEFSIKISAHFIDLPQQKNYYLMFFTILQKLLPDINLDSIVKGFKEQCNFQQTSDELSPRQLLSEKNELKEEKSALKPQVENSFKWKKRSIAVLTLFIMGMCGLGFLVNRQFNPNQTQGIQKESASIRSDLVLPIESAFLNRSELIAQIDEVFKGTRGIQAVALVGIGGSGKTTLARQYAHQQKASLIWEINVETKSNLIESFENLAHALAITEEDKEELRELQELKNLLERTKKFVEFVKGRLKLHSNWFLIYDNVEKFADIQKYFPLDAETWGHGRVILTTRDSNIQNSKYVNNTLQIGELTEKQKMNLFIKIITQETKNSFDATQIKEAKEFLREIPPFPLDVSVASYYIKTTNITYKKYLEELKKTNIELTSMQETILKESGEHTKTRYKIVTLSLEKLMESHKDFADLLLLISLLDSQNIPKDLLDSYKDYNTVDNFIYNLKKNSLISIQATSFFAEPTLSIHRSTQAIILAYLNKELKLEVNNTLTPSIASVLKNYVDDVLEKDNLLKAKHLISHLEAFLSHHELLTHSTTGLIESELGCIYSALILSAEATPYFEKALIKLRKDENKNYEQIAQNLLFQGNSYAMRLDYKKAENALEESIYMYKKYMPDKNTKLALGLVYLGNIYRWTGKHEKAKHLFHQSITLYEKIPPKACAGKVMALAYLGDIYRRLGDYPKAIAATEKSLQFCAKHLPENSVRKAWPLIFLGIIHRDLGNYERAADLINKSIVAYEKSFSKKSLYVSGALMDLAKVSCDLGHYKKAIDLADKALILSNKFKVNNLDIYYIDGFLCIGNSYLGLKNHEKAKYYLEKALIFYENQYGKNHTETASVLEGLAQVYLLTNKLERAEELLSNALDILQTNNHPRAYNCLEHFSDLHLKKSDIMVQKGAIEDAQFLKKQSINDLKKALEIIKIYFPEGSPHEIRIKSKLKKLEKS